VALSCVRNFSRKRSVDGLLVGRFQAYTNFRTGDGNTGWSISPDINGICHSNVGSQATSVHKPARVDGRHVNIHVVGFNLRN